jgi:hypothetical protein
VATENIASVSADWLVGRLSEPLKADGSSDPASDFGTQSNELIDSPLALISRVT